MKEIRLLEYSVVVFPMNPSASIETVKNVGADPCVRPVFKEPIHADAPDHSIAWEPVYHSIGQLVTQIKTINKEYSQWK